MVTLTRYINTYVVRVNGRFYCTFPISGPVTLKDVLASLV